MDKKLEERRKMGRDRNTQRQKKYFHFCYHKDDVFKYMHTFVMHMKAIYLYLIWKFQLRKIKKFYAKFWNAWIDQEFSVHGGISQKSIKKEFNQKFHLKTFPQLDESVICSSTG